MFRSPVGLSVIFGINSRREARLAEDRSLLERRAEEVLSQEELAPRKWAARLAPEALPDFAGFELGRVYQAGTGLMARAFYDLFRVAPTPIPAAVGRPSVRAKVCPSFQLPGVTVAHKQ